MDAANGGTRVLIRRRRDGTGVQNHDLSAIWRMSRLQSALDELAFNGGAIGLGGAATKILDVETSHAYILTYKVQAQSTSGIFAGAGE